MRRMVERLERWSQILGGSQPPPDRGWRGAVALGVWWAVLFAAVFATIGRATKFIYVDF